MTVSRTYRIQESADLAIKRLVSQLGKRSESEVIEAAVDALDATRAPQPDLLRKVYERQNQIEIKLDEILETVQGVRPTPGSPSEEWSHPETSTVSNDPLCRHCGQLITLRPGQPAASTCLKCVAAGHWQRPGDCRECRELAHLAGVRNQDQTGSERGDIEYDAQV